MKVVTLEEVNSNANSKLEMTQDMQDLLRIGGCLYISYSRFNLQQIHKKNTEQVALNNRRMNPAAQ